MMPTMADMRKCPPGAKALHKRFEKEPKRTILLWKNMQLALHKGTDDNEVANFERFRPRDGGLNTQNALIQGRTYDVPSPSFTANYDSIKWASDLTYEEFVSEREGLEQKIATMQELVDKAQALGLTASEGKEDAGAGSLP